MNSFIKIIFHITKFCPVDWLPALHLEYLISPQSKLNWIYQSFGTFFFPFWIILAFQLTGLWWVWINSEKSLKKKINVNAENEWEQQVIQRKRGIYTYIDNNDILGTLSYINNVSILLALSGSSTGLKKA